MPLNASSEIRFVGRAPSTASGVKESASEDAATNHSGEALVLEAARAAST